MKRTDPSIIRSVKEALARIEQHDLEIERLKAPIRGTLERIEEVERMRSDDKELIQRMLYTKEGPESQGVRLEGASKTHVWARGESLSVSVTYKRSSDYYDPAKVPRTVLLMPKVIKELDKQVLDEIAVNDTRVKLALRKGSWMAPTVQIKPITSPTAPEEAP